MTSTTATDLEQALHRYGDGLYRLALLLTPDEASAGAALAAALGRLAARPGARDKPALLAALVAALPPEPPRWRPWQRPGWARPPVAHPEVGPLLTAIARLPRLQRLALGLTTLRALDQRQVASLLGEAPEQAGVPLRDALLALAPVAAPDLTPADLAVESAPADCQPTRAALALGGERVHSDPALRGHLALCAACRAAEQDWISLSTPVEEALRGALRDVVLPASLSARLRAVIAPEVAPAVRAPSLDRRVGVALVVLLVLGLIGLVVLPRRSADRAAPATAGQSIAPRDLAQRAYDQLYALPSGSGVWHGHWEMLWNFADGSYATLEGEQWVDTVVGRHRVQLVHQSGGGPYEFELADGREQLWYASSASYGPSIYPAYFDAAQARVHLSLTPAEQQGMLRARLGSGAWNLGGAYLRQALAAPDLRSWGRQTGEDGAPQELISFRGVSPLALPPDAPDATASTATILLTIDLSSGALREVRELVGAAGQEQVGRTTWRFVGGEWIDDGAAIGRAFDLASAWNGVGEFLDQDRFADVALPLIPASAVVPLAQGMLYDGLTWMPAHAPPGATRAVLVSLSSAFVSGAPVALIYTGVGRRLVIIAQRSTVQMDQPPGGERLKLDGREATLWASNGQSYFATLIQRLPGERAFPYAQVSALGYTRAELLDVLGALGPPTTEAYRAQAGLFVDQQPRDPAAFAALLGALAAPPPQDGMTRHVVARVFSRNNPQPDPLPDPYHLPRDRGLPEQLVSETWTRGDPLGASFQRSEISRDDAGTVYSSSYRDADQAWSYDRAESRVSRFRDEARMPDYRADSDLMMVLELLACGNGQLTAQPDGGKVVTGTFLLQPLDQFSMIAPCMSQRFNNALLQQATLPLLAGAPYLLDVAGQPLLIGIALGADGRAARIDVRGGATPDAPLIMRWERVSDERLPDARVPAEAFGAPPRALTVEDYSDTIARPFRVAQPRLITLAEAPGTFETPLLYLPESDDLKLVTLEAGSTPVSDTIRLVGADDDPFSEALSHGVAMRFTYALGRGADRLLTVYSGPTAPFGAFLRSRPPAWTQSSAVQITIGARPVEGWLLLMGDGQQWLLAEVDGTLLAAQGSLDELTPLLTRFAPLGG